MPTPVRILDEMATPLKDSGNQWDIMPGEPYFGVMDWDICPGFWPSGGGNNPIGWPDEWKIKTGG